MRIALVEDDPTQAEQMKEWLSGAGYNTHWFANGDAFTQALRRESFDLILLDWNLPDTTGIELLNQIRAMETQLAVIFTTSRDDEADIVAALQNGADDYLVKPTRRAETLARIAAVVRRTIKYNDETTVSEYPPFTLDSEHFTVRFEDEQIQLTPKEFELTHFLFTNQGRLLSRNHILEAVWGISSDLTTRTVDTHVSKVRRKLGLKPDRGWRLASIYQYGYRLENLKPSDNEK